MTREQLAQVEADQIKALRAPLRVGPCVIIMTDDPGLTWEVRNAEDRRLLAVFAHRDDAIRWAQLSD